MNATVRLRSDEDVRSETGEVDGKTMLGRERGQVDDAGDGAQNLRPQPVRGSAFGLDADSPCDRDAPVPGQARQLLGQPGLADPWFASTQHHARLPAERRVETVAEHGKLWF